MLIAYFPMKTLYRPHAPQGGAELYLLYILTDRSVRLACKLSALFIIEDSFVP